MLLMLEVRSRMAERSHGNATVALADVIEAVMVAVTMSGSLLELFSSCTETGDPLDLCMYFMMSIYIIVQAASMYSIC